MVFFPLALASGSSLHQCVLSLGPDIPGQVRVTVCVLILLLLPYTSNMQNVRYHCKREESQYREEILGHSKTETQQGKLQIL